MHYLIIKLCIFGFPIFCALINYLDYYWNYVLYLFEDDISKLTFDFIIVGAGSAGCILANRLSENPNFRVLLLEAGSYPTFDFLTSIPAITPFLQKTHYDWQYRTVPQQYSCLGLNQQRSIWPRGRGVGGSSLINYMIYYRGHPRDFDNWEMMGNPGWSYENVIPYFKKSENGQVSHGRWKNYHGTDGYLPVNDQRYEVWTKDFLRAGKTMGYNSSRDCNGPEQEGFCSVHVTQTKGKRCSIYKCFLAPALNRPNLHVLTRIHAQKLLINSHNEVIGVQAERYGKIWQFKSRKEVILTAGTIGSPQLLLLSGIGPADQLNSLKIPLVANLSVGENLQDHYGTYAAFLIDEPRSILPGRELCYTEIWNYYRTGRGPLTTALAVQGSAFLKSSRVENDFNSNWPDSQIMLVTAGLSYLFFDLMAASVNMKQEIINSEFMPYEGSDAIGFLALVSRPKSRGRLWLKSTDSNTAPLIDPKYFSHPDDLQVIVDGIRSSINISTTKAFQKYGTKLAPIHLNGCKEFEFLSDDYWKCYAQYLTQTIYHPVGTCKMGPKEDKTAVVDPRLRVYEVKRLRVADASIMPTIVNSNPNAAVMMIAEKAADMIKEDWKSAPFREQLPKVNLFKEEL